MNANQGYQDDRKERGVALVIAMFALVLITGVAISLAMVSSTETAINTNYNSNTRSFYAAYSGLEEARGRMRPGHPNALGAFVAIPPNILPLNQVRYIINAQPGEAVNPTDLSPTNPFRDIQFTQEFGVPVTLMTVQTTNSVSNAVPGVPGQMFKWVRITAKTEATANLDVDGDSVIDPVTPLFYNGERQNRLLDGRQVLRVTALSVMPREGSRSGSRRLVQYDIAPTTFDLTFPSALTFDGQGSALFPANSNVYFVDGNDHAGCGAAATEPPHPAVGVVSPEDLTNITNSIPPNRRKNYIGDSPSPSVSDVSDSLDPRFTDPAELEALIEEIRLNATQIVQGPATSLPTYGTEANPTITYVDGNLTLQGDITGYGILVVTGNYTASGTVGWKGIVLVVGNGVMTVEGGGSNQYDGAVILANTRDEDGNIRDTLGPTTLDWAGGGGNGIYYSSGCINNAQNNVPYRVLSFREIVE